MQKKLLPLSILCCIFCVITIFVACGPSSPSPDSVTSKQTFFSGDANNDGIINHYDLLNIGLHWQAKGEPRSNDTTASADWQQTKANLNGKYADCNGDGTVNEKDTLLIVQKYGRNLPNRRFQAPTPTANSPKLSLVSSEDDTYRQQSNGGHITKNRSTTETRIINLTFSVSDDVGLDTIKGIAFTVHTSSTLVGLTDYGNAVWLGNRDELLFMHHIDGNTWDIALVRKDNTPPPTNNRTITASCIVTIDLSITAQPINFTIQNAVLMTTRGNLIPLQVENSAVYATT